MGYIHPAVSEICDPQSLDPICGKFDKFLADGQANMGQMVKRPWQCTSRGLDNSTELRIEKICLAVTEIWVPQVWQPPARPPGLWRQYPSSPEGCGVKSQNYSPSSVLEEAFPEWTFAEWESCRLPRPTPLQATRSSTRSVPSLKWTKHNKNSTRASSTDKSLPSYL